LSLEKNIENSLGFLRLGLVQFEGRGCWSHGDWAGYALAMFWLCSGHASTALAGALAMRWPCSGCPKMCWLCVLATFG